MHIVLALMLLHSASKSHTSSCLNNHLCTDHELHSINHVALEFTTQKMAYEVKWFVLEEQLIHYGALSEP
jgi:hypothetical protein